MKTTTNYGFKQPEGTDIVNIDDISDNFGSVDTEIKKANDKVIAHEGKGGSVHADVTTTTSGFMSVADKTKLNGIATGAQTNQNAVQSIQVVTPTGTVVGTATAANTTDTIQLKEGNNIDIAVSGKVLTVNNTYSYTHPTGDGNLHVPTTGTSNSGKVLKAGSTAGSLAWGTLTPTDVGALPTSHEGQGGSVHADVTTSASGFMSAADKTKLNGIAAGAQTNQNAVQSIQAVTSSGTAIGTATAASATDTIQLKEGSNIDIAVSGKTLTLNNTYSYTHPTSDGNLHVPATGTSNSGKVLKAGATAGSLEWVTLTSTDVGALATSHEGQGGSVHADVTTTTSGFMSAADKTKLNGIASGAQTNQNAVQSIQAVTSSGAAIGTATASNATDTIQLKEGNNISITSSGKTLTLNNTYSYTHPTGDGNVHVPATGTTNNGKVLKAGATANSSSWGQVAWSEVTGIPSSFPGSVTGNAATATRLANARTVSLSGDATGSVSFDGSANANITVTVADDSHNHTITNIDGLQTVINSKLDSSQATILCPAGQVAFFARSSAPSGWLKANGAIISRTTYSELFKAIGTTFGSGDGSTTFKIPDLRGEFFRAWDDNRGIDNGRSFGSSQSDMFGNHSHTISVGIGFGAGPSNYGAGRADGNSPQTYWSGAASYNGGNETRPRNIALLACIKY